MGVNKFSGGRELLHALQHKLNCNLFFHVVVTFTSYFKSGRSNARNKAQSLEGGFVEKRLRTTDLENKILAGERRFCFY